jgi:hypothetical protein
LWVVDAEHGMSWFNFRFDLVFVRKVARLGELWVFLLVNWLWAVGLWLQVWKGCGGLDEWVRPLLVMAGNYMVVKQGMMP